MRKKRGGAAPIYIFALTWILCALALPMFRLFSLLLAVGLSVFTAVGIGALIRKAAERKSACKADGIETVSEQTESEKEEEQSSYSPEVNAIISDGRMALREMGRLYGSIQNPGIRSKINEIMSVSDKIIRDAIDDPADVPQIRKFLDYYLPTTIKLLNAYDRMSAQDISGDNISGSMKSIEEMLDTTIAAYKKQLDSLFANQATDIQTDIEVMNGMLAREGLGGKSYLDLKDFMKQYEAQQKGSTANG